MFAASRACRNVGVAQQPLQINSPHQLLRMLLKSVDLKVKSRHGRNFLKKRVMEQWRAQRHVTDPSQQRFAMERAAAVLSALHMKEQAPTMDTPIEYDFSRKSVRSNLPFTE
jgi:hypothetical protein